MAGCSEAELLAIAVTTQARGRGIGRVLAVGVLSGLGELGAGQIKAVVAADNATVTVNEGDTAANTGTWSDPGADVVTLSASHGDVTRMMLRAPK